MAETKVNYVRLEPAKGGFILTYDVRTKQPGKGEYDNWDYSSKTEIFTEDAGEKALERLKELAELCSDLKEIHVAE